MTIHFYTVTLKTGKQYKALVRGYTWAKVLKLLGDIPKSRVTRGADSKLPTLTPAILEADKVTPEQVE